jgi:hypothetical protein
MKRQIATWLLAAAAVLTVSLGGSEAGHHRRGSASCVSCAAPAPCMTSACCAPAVQYVERQVTCYRTQMVPRTVTQKVTRMVPHQENFQVTVSVPVWKAVKQQQTVYVQQQREVEATINVCVPVTVNEKRKVMECQTVTRQVEYQYTVLKPETVERKVMSTTFTCVPEQVAVTVPVCRMVTVTCVDACGCPHTTCKPVLEYQQCMRTVMKSVPHTQEVTVRQIICRPVQQKGTRTVCELVPVEREIVVPVCHMQNTQQKVKRLVCEVVPQQREVMVNVCTYEQRQQPCTRIVMRPETVDVTCTVYECQTVPYTVTQRVPVAVPSGSCCQ